MPGKNRNALAALAVLAMAVFWSKTVRADLTELTSRPVGEDTINWGQFGIPVANVPTPASFTSAGGITGTVSLNSSGTVSLYEQCCIGVSGSFDGNFSKGDMVLYNNGNGPLTLTFDTPVQNAGAQILFNTYGAFTAQIEAFSGNTLLGEFSESGVTTENADGSAIFLGVEDQSQGITSIQYSITAAAGNPNLSQFAINQATIQAYTPAAFGVPEVSSSGSLAALTVVAASIALVYERRRST